jgi:hypothetical protein
MLSSTVKIVKMLLVSGLISADELVPTVNELNVVDCKQNIKREDVVFKLTSLTMNIMEVFNSRY